jgi:hypothetical protein
MKTMSSSGVVEPFLDAWRLVRWTSRSAGGDTVHPYGADARGQLIYTASGQISAQLMTGTPDLSAFAGLDGAAALDQLGRTTFFAYWGTFEVNDAAGTVAHHVEGSLSPSWIGTVQVRSFRFEGRDRLILTPVPVREGSPGAPDLSTGGELVWQRVR